MFCQLNCVWEGEHIQISGHCFVCSGFFFLLGPFASPICLLTTLGLISNVLIYWALSDLHYSFASQPTTCLPQPWLHASRAKALPLACCQRSSLPLAVPLAMASPTAPNQLNHFNLNSQAYQSSWWPYPGRTSVLTNLERIERAQGNNNTVLSKRQCF